jgi:acetylornithine deacetylase
MQIKIKNQLFKYIDENKDWLIKNIFGVVSQNTINSPPGGNENNGQKIIEKIFRELNLKIDRFSPDDIIELRNKPYYLQGRSYKNRDNVVGYTGEDKKSTLIFNGHIDTVPSDKFKWQKTNPFKPTMLEDKIYGLGVCDMKAGIISSIFALKAVLDLGIKIKGKVVIESVVDEEFGGANGSLACVLRGYKGDLAIITEPSSMNICISNVCSKTLLLSVSGDEGLNYFGKKSSHGNPILLMSKFLLAIKDYEEYLNFLKDKYTIYNKIKKPFNFLFSDIEAGEIGPDKILTTPGRCIARIYIMNYPDINNKRFDSMLLTFLNSYPEIKKALKEKIITIEDYSRFIEGGEIDLKDKNIKKFIKNIRENAKLITGRNLNISAALGGTDFFAFNNYGNTPCIVLGPRGGNLHAADEYVELRDLLDLSKVFSSLIYDYCC